MSACLCVSAGHGVSACVRVCVCVSAFAILRFVRARAQRMERYANGAISTTAVTNAHGKKTKREEMLDTIMKMYYVFDMDCDGRISIKELKEVCGVGRAVARHPLRLVVGAQLADVDIRGVEAFDGIDMDTLFATFGLDPNEGLSRHQFVSVMTHLFHMDEE